MWSSNLSSPVGHFASTPAAAASAAAASSPASHDAVVLFPQLSAPTVEQLGALRALPAVLQSLSSDPRKGRKARGSKLLRGGQTVGKIYDLQGTLRPTPHLGINLTPTLRTELKFSLGSFFSSSTTVPVGAARSFSLSDFAGAASLQAVFDQYKFEQLEVWIDCRNPLNNITSTPFGTAVDLDNVSVPTSMGQVADKAGSLLAVTAGGRYHRWQPHMAIAAYSGAFTSYSNVPAGWIDSASPSVEHYGIKMYSETTSVALNYSLTVRAIVSFRAPSNQ